MPFKNLPLLLLLSFSLLVSGAPSSPSIGVTYRHTIPGIPTGDTIVSALKSAGISHVHLQDPDPTTIRSFLYSGISLLLSIPNSLIPNLSSNRSASHKWLTDHVLPFHPRARITTISVGHDSLSSSLLIPAITNLHSSCIDLGLRGIPISTVHSFNIIYPSFPPSSARFKESVNIRPLLDFLSKTGSPFLIDLYPYDLYRSDDSWIPIGYAMFEEEEFSFRDDTGSGLRYRNVFDAMVDAAIGAVGRMGHRKMPVVVTGTGWPSGGGGREATDEFAERYNRGMVKHVRLGMGTPMRREGALAVYVHELFDDSRRKGEEWERHWGIWRANMSSKYEMFFSGSDCGGLGIGFGAAWGFCWLVVLLLLFLTW